MESPSSINSASSLALSDWHTMSNCNLIVNYLPQFYGDNELKHLFFGFGDIDSVHVVRDTWTGYSHGYGFVKFRNPDNAAKAVLELNGVRIQDKVIKVSYSRPPGENRAKTNLYVTNLPRHFSEFDIESLFSQFGVIIQRKLLYDKITKMSRGVAFVRFNQTSEAEAAMREINGKQFPGCIEPVHIKVADEKGKLKPQFYSGVLVGHFLSAGRSLYKERRHFHHPVPYCIRMGNNSPKTA